MTLLRYLLDNVLVLQKLLFLSFQLKHARLVSALQFVVLLQQVFYQLSLINLFNHISVPIEKLGTFQQKSGAMLLHVLCHTAWQVGKELFFFDYQDRH